MNPVRPKVKAAAAMTGVATVLVWLAGVAGIDTQGVPIEVWVFAGGLVSTVAAYLKRDGLAGAWKLLVNGEGDQLGKFFVTDEAKRRNQSGSDE